VYERVCVCLCMCVCVCESAHLPGHVRVSEYVCLCTHDIIALGIKHTKKAHCLFSLKKRSVLRDRTLAGEYVDVPSKKNATLFFSQSHKSRRRVGGPGEKMCGLVWTLPTPKTPI
jgi:hypothetical protein